MNGGERELIGDGTRFRAAMSLVDLVAPADTAVLIQGETGTGKELVARAVHQRSARAAGPFVKVNCAAIPAGLLESELFGHEKGAFTGAVAQTRGRLLMAHRGTLFLDEIGELPLELQPKLLRVLQEKEFERVGSSFTVQVDTRIVAATNQNLESMVDERLFRVDLFYRLNVFPIALPALRERATDIPLLAHHFLQEFAKRTNKAVDEIPPHVMDVLRRYSWPGNIRELQNFMERAVLMTSGRVLQPPLAELERLAPRRSGARPRTLAEVERACIADALRQANWVIGGRSGAAAALGLPRTTLIARMRKHGISRETLGWSARSHAAAACT